MSILAGFIPEDKIAEIRNTADIVDVVSSYVVLKKAGRNFLGLCPFHAEKQPSFTVSTEKQIFHCFGCGLGGNVFTFVMQYHNFAFPEAVRFVAQRHGIDVPTRQMSQSEKRKFKEKERLVDLNQEAAAYFKHVLSETRLGKRGRDYITKRQMTPEVIDRFGLGYAPAGWRNLVQYFSGKGLSIDDAERAGLVIAKKGSHYDRFRDRIMFPIFDIHERVVGFGGRSLDESPPKYLNSPETPVYQKSRVLYGLHAAKETCRQTGSVFVVEGYFDLLALYCHGIKNVVATLGTALTREHVRILRGFAERVTLVFDSDEAGVKAFERSLPLFVEEKLRACAMILPEGKDPDSYVFDVGKDGFAQRAEQALDQISFLIESAINKHGLSPEGKVRIVDTLKGPLGSFVHGVRRAVYIKELGERLDIDESAILDQVRRSANKGAKRIPVGEKRHASRLEQTIVAMMLQCPEILSSFNAQEIVESLETTVLRQVGQMILARGGANQPVTSADLIPQTQDPQVRNVISSLSLEDRDWDRESCLKIVGQYQVRMRKQQERLFLKRIREAENTNNQELLHQLLVEKQTRARQSKRILKGTGHSGLEGDFYGREVQN